MDASSKPAEPTAPSRGRLIVFEGIDGAGKGTQAERLRARLHAAGRRVTLIGFPRYAATFFGRRVGDFLNGQFGTLAAADPFLVSLLYAGDRYESRPLLAQALAEHEIVILDRYVPSNFAHQASKRTGAERQQLIDWIEHVEYGVFQLPRPDLVLLLDLPAATAQQLIARKRPRDYTAQAADLQEADLQHLAAARETYVQLAATRPEWRVISGEADAQLRSIDAVAEEVWQTVARAP